MDLLEYQAKEWFREVGIPVLPHQRIDRPQDLKGLKIPYPVVLKSQVPIGGRSRAGGIRFVENTIDAIAAAQTIFHLSILGELPEVLLAEAKYNADREFYLAVVLDTTVRRPVLLGSTEGGINVESSAANMQHVVVEQDFSPFYARRLALKMGLQGALIVSVSAVVAKMYELFVQKDLDLVEINPLGVNATGELMALDGKVTANDGAIARHSDIALMAAKIANRTNGQKAALGSWDEVDPAGNIGVLGNGAGLVIATLDLLTRAGSKPAACLNVGHEDNLHTSPYSFCERLEQGLESLSQNKSIQVVLVNILSSIPTAGQVAEVIAKFVRSRERTSCNGRSRAQLPRFIIRLAGSQLNMARECLTRAGGHGSGLLLMEDLDDAVTQAVRLASLSPAGRKTC